MKTLFAFMALALTASQAMSANLEFSQPEPRNWSGVGFNEDGERVTTTNEKDADNARRTIYIKCPGKCDYILPYPTGVCVAIATDGSKPYAYVNDYSRTSAYEAEGKAMIRCGNRGYSCRIVFSNCG